MIYLVGGLCLLGCGVIASSIRREEARPVCPNCGAALASRQTDRCPDCLLWQPPDRQRPSYQWRRHRAVVGVLLVVLPVLTWLLVPLVVRETFAPPPPPPRSARPGVSAWLRSRRNVQGLKALPPTLRNLTPKQIAQLRELGYLPARPGTTRPATTRPGKLSNFSPEVIKALRSLGYTPDGEEPAQDAEGPSEKPD